MARVGVWVGNKIIIVEGLREGARVPLDQGFNVLSMASTFYVVATAKNAEL